MFGLAIVLIFVGRAESDDNEKDELNFLVFDNLNLGLRYQKTIIIIWLRGVYVV